MKKSLLLILFLPFMVGLSTPPILGGCSSLQNDGGVLKSIDGGVKWEAKNSLIEGGSIASADVSGIFFDETDNNTMFLTTRGKGVLKSVDAGESWQNTIISSGNVYKIVFNPKNRDVIYIAGYIGDAGAVYKTTDAGKNWEAIYTDPLAEYAVFDVVVDHFNPDLVYIATGWGGVLKSLDAGASWARVHELGAVPRKLIMDTSDSRKIWAVTYDKGVWLTIDGGEVWEEVVLENIAEFTATINQFVVDLEEPNNFYVASDTGLLISRDSGETWIKVTELVPSGVLPIVALEFNPKNKSELFYATPNSVFKTTNLGGSWQVKQIMTGRLVRQIAIHPDNEDIIYLGLGK